MQDYKLQWHPAFQAALQIEFEEDADHLQFLSEHNLTKKPLQIDTLVLREKGYICQQDIGKIFLQHNIIEYKNPGDYFSVNDFYKVMGLACIYQSDTHHIMEIDPSEITITIVVGNYPRKLIRHLKKRFSVEAAQKFPGIYYIESGLLFPVQIVVNTELSSEKYTWLSRLRTDLDVKADIEILSEAYKGKEKQPLYEAVMDLIMRANEEKYEEAKSMCNALRELFADELAEKESEAVERGMRKGMQQGIQALIEVCKSFNATREDTMDKVMQKFSVSSEMVQEYMQKYW